MTEGILPISPPRLKICGLSTPDSVGWAIDAGADAIGLVSFPPSPRHVEPDRLAGLADLARGRARIVLLTVDADDALLETLVAAGHPDLLQLHGRETTDRVAAVRSRFGLPVMKALGIATAADVEKARAYDRIADLLLFDAKPPKDATRPGGLGATFDWNLLREPGFATPFLLSGGLTPTNVGEAIARVRPAGVDVSSGVETAPGIKDEALIRAFASAVKSAGETPAV
ncbi:phosphoribosylanthranilate isomerase [Chthonobacter albigriseus]|uniref:phosphoribosylanthranilate isomerase n=1 Tax=Chthonobacter albigriseus TaxID=1683161 RepID=UPI0015EECC1F|nr:phosphoribosylanthranilate isomerase [Chthonobacter albigriseus]